MNNEILQKLIGKTIARIERTAANPDAIPYEPDYNGGLVLHFSDGVIVTMTHIQDCCESVWLEDVCGDFDDLLHTPLLQFEEATQTSATDWGDSTTWTFYKLATVRGSVTLRWCGTSNGYYSESVDVLVEGLK